MATPHKSKKITKTVSTKKIVSGGICFVIMPFGGWFDSYYSDIYCPAILKSGLDPRRADDLYRPSNIVQDIWDLTKKAKLLLADLTNKNANVFYELGLAHALAKPVIIITESIDDIPFDLRSLRIIEYDKNEPGWGITLQKKITNAIKETIASPHETIPTAFLETKRSEVTTPAITKQEKELLEVKQELELIKRQIIPRTSSPSSIGYSPILMKKLAHQILVSGETPRNTIASLTAQFNVSERTASAIVKEVLQQSNDPTELKE